MGDKLFVIHDSKALSRELWERFCECARASGLATSVALARALQDFVDSRKDSPDEHDTK